MFARNMMIAVTTGSGLMISPLAMAQAIGTAAPQHMAAPLAAQASFAPQVTADDPLTDDLPSYDQTVKTRLMPQLRNIIDQMLAQQRDMTIDGVRVFDSNDRFLPGKIAIGIAHLILDGDLTAAEQAEYLSAFRRISALTVDDANDSWGIYYYVSALYSLKQAGLLDQAIAPATLAALRAKLDWRSFVRSDDFSLISLPNNYYGVAFSIAQLRHLMGWEDSSASEQLLARSLNHYREYSGEFGFADETPGDGRYDRYSVLLIGEFAQRFIETGLETPPEILVWLRKSVDLMMLRVNPRGEGFEYGRSLGPYSESAFLEVFSAAAALGILTPQETDIAYSFSAQVAQRYQNIWFDPEMGSVNLWEKGRRTDAYRGKHRILGENLSLSHQQIYTNKIWNRLGFQGRKPPVDLAKFQHSLPNSTFTQFATGAYDRGLVTMIDGDRLISLPLVNGAGGQHDHNPYYPIPFSPDMLEGSADADFPQMIPRITLADGDVLMPLAWFEGIDHQTRDAMTTVRYYQRAMDRLGENAPIKDSRIASSTRYDFAPGQITRSERFTVAENVEIAKVEMVFASLSHGATQTGTAIRFKHGAVKAFNVNGLQQCSISENGLGSDYQIATKALASVVTCNSIAPKTGRDFTIGWTMRYDPKR